MPPNTMPSNRGYMCSRMPQHRSRYAPEGYHRCSECGKLVKDGSECPSCRLRAFDAAAMVRAVAISRMDDAEYAASVARRAARREGMSRREEPAKPAAGCKPKHTSRSQVFEYSRGTEHECRQCGKRYAVGMFGALKFYCSKKCRNRHEYERVRYRCGDVSDAPNARTYMCVECGEEFASTATGRKPTLCPGCREARRVESSKRSHERMSANKPPKERMFVCERCGSEFIVRNSGNPRFCGDACRKEHNREYRRKYYAEHLSADAREKMFEQRKIGG